MSTDKQIEIEHIKKEIEHLASSPLYPYRIENNYHSVIGEGSLDAKIVFVGEAPGKKEAETGKPFCGKSGKILDELLASTSLDRNTVYITNIVKDRPPENRDPTQEEIGLYGPFLDRQIEIIQPEIIATLGRFSMEYVLSRYGSEGRMVPIRKAHGHIFEVRVKYGNVKVIPLYHPAASIYNQKLKQTLFDDFQKIKTKNK